MRKVLLLSAVGLVLVTSSAFASDNLGLGVIVGEPTGLSAKVWTSHSSAVDAAAAWSFGDNGALHLHADYLVHKFHLIHVEDGNMAVHFGLGLRVLLDDQDRLGARIPIGLTYFFENAPLDIFLETVPLLDFAPESEWNLNLAIGMRFFFGNKGSFSR